MRFSAFIEGHLDEIVLDWEAFASTMLPSAQTMSRLALQDHGRAILLAIAKDMETGQSEAERSTKSKGAELVAGAPQTAAATHGVLRQLSGFDLAQLVGEFRAMRASVLSLWRRQPSANQGQSAIEEIARFNEGIDQALAESVDSYSKGVEGSREMFLAILGHDLRGPLSGIQLSNRPTCWECAASASPKRPPSCSDWAPSSTAEGFSPCSTASSWSRRRARAIRPTGALIPTR